MDLIEEPDFSDSGMESLATSKDETPERKPEPEDQVALLEKNHPSKEVCKKNACDDCSDEPDETVGERIWGLTEMFPPGVRNASHTLISSSCSGAKSAYSISRNVLWIIASSCVILFAPVIFELERAQVDEMQKSQQKQDENVQTQQETEPEVTANEQIETPIWAKRRRPVLSEKNERTDGMLSVVSSIQNVNKKKVDIEELRGTLVLEEITFKRELWKNQLLKSEVELESAQVELEIKMETLKKIKGDLTSIFKVGRDKIRDKFMSRFEYN